MDSQEAPALLSRLRSNIESVLPGKSRVAELALASFLAGGHILLEEHPRHRQDHPRAGGFR